MAMCMILLALCLSSGSLASKIMLLPAPIPSKTAQVKAMGDGLVDKGHEVYIVLPPMHPAIKNIKGEGKITVLSYNMAEKDRFAMPHPDKEQTKKTLDFWMNNHPLDVMEGTADPKQGFFQWCTNLLEDEDFIQKLKNMKFDIVILDAHMLIRCFYIVPYRMGVPYISVNTFPEFWLSRTPALPSFVPYTFGFPAYTTEMSFFERLDNLWTQLKFAHNRPYMQQRDDKLVAKYAPDLPAVSLTHLARQSLMWFIDSHPAIDYARPVMPNEVYTGGATIKSAQPLPKDLEDFVNGAEHGVIVISFGAMVTTLPDRLTNVLLEVLGNVKQKVIWRFSFDEPEKVPKNILAVNWLPQGDLLAHKKTKLFITHCGANGQFEALYHGVPMLGIPMFGEQRYNAQRMQYKQLGRFVYTQDLTVETLTETLNEVLENPKYKKNIMKASAIYRDGPFDAVGTAVYWTEHVLKYGGEHLHSYGVDMPWYQYLMLDILLFVTLIPLIICVVIYRVIRKITG